MTIFAGSLIIALFVFGNIAATYAAVFSTVAVLALFGFTMQYAQEFVSDWFGSSWGDSMDTKTKFYVITTLIVAAVVVIGLMYIFMKVSRFFIRSLIMSILAMVSIRALWYNDIMPTEICCSVDNAVKCPVYLTPVDFAGILGFFWVRLVCYACYKYYSKSAEQLKITNKILREKVPLLPRDVRGVIVQSKDQG
jgi:hypothetical protein